MNFTSRLGDLSTNDPCGAPPRPSSTASPDVLCNMIPVHRLTDAWVPHNCPGAGPHGAVTSLVPTTVLVNMKYKSIIGSGISCGSKIATGSGNILVG